MRKGKPHVIFVLSVDTEEEWNWDMPFPQVDPSVDNASALPDFQAFCTALGIKPTYFIDYAMANNANSASTLQRVVADGQCEFGAHLHPWCNPPLIEANGDFESHVVNLPRELVEQKLHRLIEKLEATFHVNINAFRTGRWGINPEVMELLIAKGISVDSSVYPYYRNEYFSCDGAPVTPYWPDLTNALRPGNQKKLAEIPVSAGFNNQYFGFSNTLYNIINHKKLQFLRLTGIAWQTKLLRKIYLSPELTAAADMNRLISALLRKQVPIIHMNLHSSSLIPHAYNNNQFSCKQIYSNMTQTINFLSSKAHVSFCTISEAAERLLA